MRLLTLSAALQSLSQLTTSDLDVIEVLDFLVKSKHARKVPTSKGRPHTWQLTKFPSTSTTCAKKREAPAYRGLLSLCNVIENSPVRRVPNGRQRSRFRYRHLPHPISPDDFSDDCDDRVVLSMGTSNGKGALENICLMTGYKKENTARERASNAHHIIRSLSHQMEADPCRFPWTQGFASKETRY
ncbi:hypothetical protein BKA70DRAFT_40899 [Coprinopsis sp. MPI-PUGE-AT-0042]|nr:hypothetical protein BKA70DRAFT_40899 [Coprinopsis sp. MPI-PUGE-AT-0042]